MHQKWCSFYLLFHFQNIVQSWMDSESLKGRKSARRRSPESPARHADRTSEEKPVHEPLRPRCRRGRRGAASACTDGRPGLRRGGRGVHAERACLVDDGERNGAGCGGRSARHAVARCSAAAGSSSVMTLTVEEFPELQPTSAARTPTAMISLCMAETDSDDRYAFSRPRRRKRPPAAPHPTSTPSMACRPGAPPGVGARTNVPRGEGAGRATMTQIGTAAGSTTRAGIPTPRRACSRPATPRP